MANGSNGDRDQRGRFGAGNAAAKGRARPHAARVAELRTALLEAITPAVVRQVVESLVAEAARGNVLAARELLDRALGKPLEADILQRLDDLENERSAPGAHAQ